MPTREPEYGQNSAHVRFEVIEENVSVQVLQRADYAADRQLVQLLLRRAHSLALHSPFRMLSNF